MDVHSHQITMGTIEVKAGRDDRVRWNLVIPKGFEWDGASVPRFLWSLSGIRPDGLLRAAALVHDYIYRSKGRGVGWDRETGNPLGWLFTRKEADVLFYDMIREAGGGWWTAIRAYRAVRMFGWLAWKS
jgi:hypothetical protein